MNLDRRFSAAGQKADAAFPDAMHHFRLTFMTHRVTFSV